MGFMKWSQTEDNSDETLERKERYIMTNEHKTNDGLTKAMRWAARLIGLVAIGLFAAFVFTSGASIIPSLSLTDAQGLPLLIALILALAGVLVAWKRELVGGIMTMVGSVAIIAMVCLGSGSDMFLCSLFFTGPLLVAGVLYLACCYRTKSPVVGKA
jgi:hypothetical protein